MSPRITPIPSHFLLCVPDVVNTKPTEPMTADTWVTVSTPRTWILKFSRAIRSVGQLSDMLMNFKINVHPSILAAMTRATKYPIVNHVQRVRVALNRVLSYRMNPARTKPVIRASMTVSNQVALLEVTAFASAFIALWFHSKQPKSWLPAIVLGIIIIVVAVGQIILLTTSIPSTGISQLIQSTANFTLPYVS